VEVITQFGFDAHSCALVAVESREEGAVQKFSAPALDTIMVRNAVPHVAGLSNIDHFVDAVLSLR
jgi:hypothetical protein